MTKTTQKHKPHQKRVFHTAHYNLFARWIPLLNFQSEQQAVIFALSLAKLFKLDFEGFNEEKFMATCGFVKNGTENADNSN